MLPAGLGTGRGATRVPAGSDATREATEAIKQARFTELFGAQLEDGRKEARAAVAAQSAGREAADYVKFAPVNYPVQVSSCAFAHHLILRSAACVRHSWRRSTATGAWHQIQMLVT